MEAAAQPSLHLVEDPLSGFDGELTPANLCLLADRVRELDAAKRSIAVELEVTKRHEKQLERDVKGWRLRLAKLEEDREAKALAAPERPMVEVLWRVWKIACDRPRSALHFTDRERIAAAIRHLSFATCLATVAGAAYDPRYSDPMRNGKRQRYDSLELLFRSFGKAESFADRVPNGWAPNAAKVAELAGVEAALVEEWLKAVPS